MILTLPLPFRSRNIIVLPRILHMQVIQIEILIAKGARVARLDLEILRQAHVAGFVDLPCCLVFAGAAVEVEGAVVERAGAVAAEVLGPEIDLG